MKSFIAVIAVLLLSVQFAAGQEDTGSTTTTTQTQQQAPESTVQFFFVACGDQAVVNFSGLLTSGRDIYYQVLAGETPLTSLRQVQQDGNFAYSERVAYINGQTLGGGTTATLRVLIAREGSPNSPEFDSTATDVQDGCAAPQNPEGTSIDLGGGEPERQQPVSPALARILTPQGTILNETLNPEDPVVLGSRISDTYRSPTPGLIFAECDDFPLATPGVVYDTDNVVIFWSWFVKEEEFLGEHLEASNYSVKMNTAPLDDPQTVGPAEVDGLLWFFYVAPIGNLRPGHYEIEYRVTWDRQISDGFQNFGPGTSNEIEASNCNFDVVPNPVGGVERRYTNQFYPSDGPVHDIDPEY